MQNVFSNILQLVQPVIWVDVFTFEPSVVLPTMQLLKFVWRWVKPNYLLKTQDKYLQTFLMNYKDLPVTLDLLE